MGRPRSFNETAVLDAAAAEFRVHGFAETSTEQLCEAAGMLRGSLYNAFTSKDELFHQALERYASKYRERQEAILADEALSGADRLRAVLEVIVREEHDAHRDGETSTHGAGCMVVHTMMNPDLRERDGRVARIIDRDLRARLTCLEDAIRAGQSDGSIPASVDPADGALLFVTVVNGLRVMGQAGTAPEVLHRIAVAGLSSILG